MKTKALFDKSFPLIFAYYAILIITRSIVFYSNIAMVFLTVAYITISFEYLCSFYNNKTKTENTLVKFNNTSTYLAFYLIAIWFWCLNYFQQFEKYFFWSKEGLLIISIVILMLLCGLLLLKFALSKDNSIFKINLSWALLMVCYFLLHLVAISKISIVKCDVYYFLDLGAKAILSGINPYSVTYPQIFIPEGLPFLYDSRIASVDRVFFQPYPPFPLILALLGIIFGDVRYTHLILLLATAILIKYLLKIHLKNNNGYPALISVFALFQPINISLIMNGYNDIFISCLFTIFVLFSLTNNKIMTIISASILFSLKQYTILFFLPFLVTIKPTRSQLFAILCIISLPLLIFCYLNPSGFYHGVILFQFLQPYRQDSLSLISFIDNNFGYNIYNTFFYVMLLIVSQLLVYIKRNNTKSFSRASRVYFFLNSSLFCFANFLYFSKQSFANYFSVLQTLILLTLLLSYINFQANFDEK